MKLASLFALLALSACSTFDSNETKGCEEWVLGKIKSPGTYKRVEADSISYEGYHAVTIVFDSENSFGALIRSKAICRYDDNNGKPGDFNEGQSALIDGAGPLGEFAR